MQATGESIGTTGGALSQGAQDVERDRLDGLYQRVYEQLRRVARSERRRWLGAASLSTTALVHEAYLRLAGAAKLDPEGQRHVLRVAMRAMRYVLTDRARARQRQKRGGGCIRVALEEGMATAATDEDVLAVDAALRRLHVHYPRQARVVECRFFGGLSIEETAGVLGLSTATVKRDWAAARRWLHRRLSLATVP